MNIESTGSMRAERPGIIDTIATRIRTLSARMREKIIRRLGGVPADWNCYSVHYARSEMDLAWPEKDDMQDEVKACVLDLMAVFANQGHSGFSAGYARNVFDRVLRFEPITPLTGADHEWSEPVDDDGMRQNKRCSRIFKGSDGRAYDIEGRIFREPDGVCFTGPGSLVYIDFPYTPTTEYVDVTRESDV